MRRFQPTGERPGSRAIALALVATALSACSSSDLLDPSASKLRPDARPSAATGVAAPSVAQIYLCPDSGFDRKTWETPVGKKAYFSVLAYDAQGRSIPASSLTPVFRSNTPKVFTVDSVTGVGSATTAGYFSVTVTVGSLSSTAGFIASGTATVAAAPAPAPAPAPTPTPAPTPAATPSPIGTVTASSVALTVVRFDGRSGAATVSAGIPLVAGALRPGQEAAVRVYLGGVEQPAYVSGLASRHADGSLRTVLVQFQAASLPSTGATGTLAIGTARSAAMTIANPIVVPGAAVSGTPSGLPQAAALPSSVSYLLSTDLVGGTVSSAAAQGAGATYARYESDFAKYADQFWTRDGAEWSLANYYDRALIYYAMWARTGNISYWARAGQLAADYRQKYLVANAYGSSPHWAQLEGLEKHYLLTGDEASRQAVVRTAGVLSAYLPTEYMKPLNGESRIAARVLHAQLLAWRLTPAGAPAIPAIPGTPTWGANIEAALAKIGAWQQPDGSYPATGQACGGQLNYMIGLLNDALVKTYDYYVPTTTSRTAMQGTIRTLVTRSVDYLWTTQWLPASNAFQYASVNCTADVGGKEAAPDLNNMISPSFGWVYRQTGDAKYRTAGETIFAGGVTQAYLAGTKQFNENYTSSFRYLGYR